MSDAAIIAICVFGVVALAVICYALYSSNKQTARGDAAQAVEEQAVRAQEVAEQTRDQEHVARVAAETALEDMRTQYTSMQLAWTNINQEHLDAIGKAISSGDSDAAIAAIRRVWSQAASTGAAHAATGGQAAAAAAVQPTSGVASADVAKPDPRP